MIEKLSKEEIEFLTQSNLIEGEKSAVAMRDAQDAWIFAKDFVDRNQKFTVNLVLGIHKILMQTINPEIAGKFRNCDVFIGGRRKPFILDALIVEDVESCLLKMSCNMVMPVHDPKDYTNIKSTVCLNSHIEFEFIHPFIDGNGRVGRILWNLDRINCGLPLEIIHAGKEQFEYYKNFE